MVINEVQTGAYDPEYVAGDEFVELYNPNNCAVDLTGYALLYRASMGTSDIALVNIALTIGGNGYLVFGGTSFSGAADGWFGAGTGLKDIGGGVALNDGTQDISTMGWGDATNAFVLGAAASATDPDPSTPPVTRSLSLFPNGYISGDNASDFHVTTTPTPGGPNSIN